MNTKNMPTHVTFIIRDESPLMIGEPVSNRRVTITLTDEQRIALELKDLGGIGTEKFSTIFTEFKSITP